MPHVTERAAKKQNPLKSRGSLLRSYASIGLHACPALDCRWASGMWKGRGREGKNTACGRGGGGDVGGQGGVSRVIPLAQSGGAAAPPCRAPLICSHSLLSQDPGSWLASTKSGGRRRAERREREREIGGDRDERERSSEIERERESRERDS